MSTGFTGIYYRILKLILVPVTLFFISLNVSGKPADLRSFTQNELIRISEHLRPHFERIQKSLHKKEVNVEKDIEAIKALSMYAFEESAMSIWHRLRLDLTNFDQSQHPKSSELRQTAMTALLEMVSNEKDDAIFIDIKKSTERLEEHLNQHRVNHEQLQIVAKEMRGLLRRLETKGPTPKLETFDSLLEEQSRSRQNAVKQLARFSEVLRSRIKGQDEVIEAMEAQQWESQFIAAKNRTPSIIYLMGAPGTGKDTSAEAFADALSGYEGAYKQHMYRLPIMRTQPDLWQVLGSATGYVGSSQFPPFLQFLVEHSGGKYILKKEGSETSIHQNPDWKGFNLPGHAAPESAVVFVNEFHNWSKEIKDVLIKQALEKGIFNINNPRGGLQEIQVPVRFVIASNEGISLTSSREANGQRHGKPLTYEQSKKKHDLVKYDKKRLKNEIMAGNGAARDPGGNRITGISEELLNRIPDQYLILMAPFAPETIQEIADIELRKVAGDLENPTPLNPGLKVTWDLDLLKTLQEYDYNSEDNARAIAPKVKSMVIKPLIQILRSRDLPLDQALNLKVELIENSDGTWSLKVEIFSANGQSLGIYTQDISYTEKSRHRAPISDERIDQLADLDQRIGKRVFGVEPITKRIAERVMSLANQTVSSEKAPRNASAIVLMGLSSTGKTELAKAVTEALTGNEKDALTIDFSQVQSIHDFKNRILGNRDAYGNPIPSDFMMHYDRGNGDVVVIFDELSNVRDPDLLKSLYDFFREPVLSTFSDGKDRVMSQVKVIVTGNSGLELFKNVPRNVPMEQQMVAWEQIAKGLINDEETQRAVLERSFPEPLINRWGRNNIFFVPPHTYKSLKQLSIFKLNKMIQTLRPQEGRRGWEIGFANKSDLESFVRNLIEVAFNLREQGASIDNYVRDDIQATLEAKLLMSKVPSGSKVLIKKISDQFVLIGQNKEIISTLELKKKKGVDEEDDTEPHPDDTMQTLTAYHEVGHAVTAKVLMHGQQDPSEITIVPGVTKIGDQWIAYAGVARNKVVQNPNITREWVIRRIAILAAGETAERLVSVSEVHSGGKRNDMERATRLAEDAVLIYGLSEAWGTEAVPAGSDLRSYVDGFSPSKKERFEAEVKKLIDEGRTLARDILNANFESVVVPMSKELAEKGTMKAAEMAPHFQALRLYEKKASWLSRAGTWVQQRLSKKAKPHELRDGVIKSRDYLPRSVANIKVILENKKNAQFDEVELPADFPIFQEVEFMPGDVNKMTCEDALR